MSVFSTSYCFDEMQASISVGIGLTYAAYIHHASVLCHCNIHFSMFNPAPKMLHIQNYRWQLKRDGICAFIRP